MNSNEIAIPKKIIYKIGFVVFVVLLILAVKFPLSRTGQSANASNLAAGSPEKFAFLSGQGEQRSVGST